MLPFTDWHLGTEPTTAWIPSTVGVGGPVRRLEAVERDHVLFVLGFYRGNRTHAAEALGIGLRTLQRKLRAWGFAAPTVPNEEKT